MKQVGFLVAGLAVFLTAATASAGPIIPNATVVPLAVTFGGSGIPNDAVAVTTFLDGLNIVTLGLTATARYSNLPVTNDGSATFFADAGGDFLDPLHFAPSLARWNFDFYVGSNTTNYVYSLLYDFDPGVGTDEADLGKINFGCATVCQDSWNLGMGFLAVAIPTVLNPPLFPSFNPNAAGEYSFALIAKDLAGNEVGRTAMNVNAVPEPASMLLLGTGLAGLVARRRKKTESAN